MIGATKSYGDQDVWDYTLNSRDAAVEYAHVRDFNNGLTYAGWISVFSESNSLRELVLRDVQISDLETGEHLYEAPRIYLAREPTEMTLEFPYLEGDSVLENSNDQ